MKYTWMSWGITRENKNISSQKIGVWIKLWIGGMDRVWSHTLHFDWYPGDPGVMTTMGNHLA